MKRVLLTTFLIALTVTLRPVYAGKPVDKPVLIPNSVCIDPGHGGNDPGATYSDLKESEINLNVALSLKNKLTSNGYIVYLTRENNNASLSNSDRYNFCNNKKTAMLVSIHHNGSTNAGANYSQALYMKKSDEPLAKLIVNSISSTLGFTNNGISRFASGVLLKANMPATISEGFFITNSSLYNYIKDGSMIDKEAEALYIAIYNYLN